MTNISKRITGGSKKIKNGFKKFWRRYRIRIIIFLLVLAFIIAYLWHNIFISIYPGHAGVKWERFYGGTVTDKVCGEGLHIIWPWDKIYDYSLRVQERHNRVKILTTAGLSVDMDISFRFYPAGKSVLPFLHQKWGPDYSDKFVEPEAKANAIAVIGEYPPKELFSLDTIEIQKKIKERLKQKFKAADIVLQDFLITHLSLPKTITNAIEKKLTQEQLLQEYEFKLAVARKEKERKEVEAQGLKLFEGISGISILKWKGLAVTSEIARSENSKVIIVGTGSKDLPVILNAEK